MGKDFTVVLTLLFEDEVELETFVEAIDAPTADEAVETAIDRAGAGKTIDAWAVEVFTGDVTGARIPTLD